MENVTDCQEDEEKKEVSKARRAMSWLGEPVEFRPMRGSCA